MSELNIQTGTQGRAAVKIMKDWTVFLHEKEIEMSNECRQVIYEVSKCYQPNTQLQPPPNTGRTHPLPDLTDDDFNALFDYIEAARGTAAQAHWASSESMRSWESRRKEVIAAAARKFMEGLR